LAIAVAVDRSIVRTEKLSIDVVTEGDRAGQTFINKSGQPNVDVCMNIDNKKFMKLWKKY